MGNERFVIGGGTVVTPGMAGQADVVIEGGSIVAITPANPEHRAPDPGVRFLDARNLMVLPCGIDPHVHLAMPAGAYRSSDDFSSGSAAALRGGTAGIVDFVEVEGAESLLDALDKRLAEVEASRIPTKLHMTISAWGDDTASEMAACVARGVKSFKIYLAYLDSIGVDDEAAFKVLETARDLGASVLVHAEAGRAVDELRAAFASSGRLEPRYHGLSRPPECEAAAIAKVVAMVRRLGGPRTVIAHVSSELGMREIVVAKDEGLPLFAETCPHYLAFDASRYLLPATEAARFVMSPPLRSARDVEYLWERVADGSVDFVSTDHCPFQSCEKDGNAGDFTTIPNGVGGIAERAAYVLGEGTRRGVDLARLSALLATNAARFHGFPFGALEPGQAANLCLWRIGPSYTYRKEMGGSLCDYSIYDDMEFSAAPLQVYLDGALVSENWKMR